jgi:hypothetical protein
VEVCICIVFSRHFLLCTYHFCLKQETYRCNSNQVTEKLAPWYRKVCTYRKVRA